MLSQQMSRCQRQISECCNDSLEICFLDKCDTDGVAFDYVDVDDDKHNMYEVDYSLNNYRTGYGTTDDSDEIVWNSSGYRKGKTVSCIYIPYKLPVYLILAHLYILFIIY